MASVAHLITRAEVIAKRINLSDKVAVVVQAPEPIPGPILLFPDESHGASNSKAPHGTRFASDALGDSAMSPVLPLPSLGVSSLDLGRSLGGPFLREVHARARGIQDRLMYDEADLEVGL